jgi:hypothetical protein
VIETESVVVKDFHKNHFDSKTLAITRFRQILNSPTEILSTHESTKSEFKRVYKLLSAQKDPDQVLYLAIARALDLPLPNSANRYIGNYKCFRKSDIKGDLITGSIKILKNLNGQNSFEHFSTQPIGQRKRTFNHRGPVFLLSNRVYLVGLGSEEPSPYVRPIILNAVDDPTKRELLGMLFTETVNNIPFASLTVLIHETFECELRREYSSDEMFLSYINELLRNKSASPDFIYGWSRSDK